MEKFCPKCGAAANEAATACPNCGAPLGRPAGSAYPQAAPQSYPPPPNYPASAYPAPTYAQAPPAKKSNTALKWIIGILVALLVLGGLLVGCVYYIAHKVKGRLEAMTAETSQEMANVPPLKMPVCSLLSMDEVGAAIGVPVVTAQPTAENTCTYYAKGTAGDMASRHIAAIAKQSGATAQQQQMIEQFSGIFRTQKQNGANQQDSGTAAVLVVDIDTVEAHLTMKIDRSLLGNQPGSQTIGIGDEAFDANGTMLMVRQGSHLIRFNYAGCPCATDAIKPLAKKVASRL